MDTAKSANGVSDDQDIHKGAKEDDRPTERSSRTGVDREGLPNDPVATAEDRNGATADDTQG